MFRLFSFKKKPHVEIFVRHCHYSAASAHKERFATFSKEKCFRNLLNTIDQDRVGVTFFLDTHYPSEGRHFLSKQAQHPIVEVKAGNEAASFLAMIDYVAAQDLNPDTIIYFLEDDYIHKQGWVDVLVEGMGIEGVDYVTLFDHRDKYFFPSYVDLRSKIFYTDSCHWRTTPSTTNTYAMRFKTLIKHLPVHKAFSEGRKITADHDKFCRLYEIGAVLASSIPGFSTHVEPEFASPCVNWNEVLEDSLNDFKK